MQKAGLITFCLIMVLGTNAQAQDHNLQTSQPNARYRTSQWKAQWRMGLAGRDIRDERSQSKTVDILTDIKANYKLADTLSLDIQPLLRLQTGQVQTFNGADKQDSRILLNQAAVHFQPVNVFKLSGGALNQRYVHSDLMVDNMSFPGARLEMHARADKWSFSALGETAIPTSTSLSTNTKELEETPSLNSGGIAIQWKPSRNMGLKLSGTYFEYKNLPSTVAQDSGLLGNDIILVSDSDYQFAHEHKGYQARLEAQVPVNYALNLTFGADMIRNTQVSEELGLGYKFYHESRLRLKHNIDLIVRGAYFSLAPEAAVSYFNARWYETNRVGYSAETSLAFNKQRFEIGVRYMDSEVMYINTVQSREKTWLIKLETFYADI